MDHKALACSSDRGTFGPGCQKMQMKNFQLGTGKITEGSVWGGKEVRAVIPGLAEGQS